MLLGSFIYHLSLMEKLKHHLNPQVASFQGGQLGGIREMLWVVGFRTIMELLRLENALR